MVPRLGAGGGSRVQRLYTVAGHPRHTLSQTLDCGHSAGTQLPVTPAVPCPSWYGADATSGRVDHSVTLSRCPAGIAGVVGSINEM
jgi:hypothetical protein